MSIRSLSGDVITVTEGKVEAWSRPQAKDKFPNVLGHVAAVSGCRVHMEIPEGELGSVTCINDSCSGDCKLMTTVDGHNTHYHCDCA